LVAKVATAAFQQGVNYTSAANFRRQPRPK